MDIINFSNLESQVLSHFNEGNKTFDSLLDILSINEKTLVNVLEGLISKNILKLDNKSGHYIYQTKVSGEIVILDGNLLLPTTIITTEDKLLVSRGEWYEFPLDFDIRRIVWNIKLESKTNSTLVDLIKTSVLKEKKSRIVQVEEYANLVNKVVPFSDKIGLHIHCVGEHVTDVSILFIQNIGKDVVVQHKGFALRSEISTDQLIGELQKGVDERNYSENIQLNKIYNFSDFIFAKNEIPIEITDNELVYVKITGVRKGFELTYFKMDSNGLNKKIDVEGFEDSSEGIEKLRDLFRGLPALILAENNILTEMTE